MQDLESGLSFMLNVEVATKPIIQGDEYLALRNFIGMLAKVTQRFHPFSEVRYMCVIHCVSLSYDKITSVEWLIQSLFYSVNDNANDCDDNDDDIC